MIASGMQDGAVVNFLRGLYDKTTAAKDQRWQERYDDIPRAVTSARKKFARANEPEPKDKPKTSEQAVSKPSENITPCTIEETLKVFDKWLLLEDQTPVITILGAVAANLLPGDPVWLGIIAPPSSAKTEILNSISHAAEHRTSGDADSRRSFIWNIEETTRCESRCERRIAAPNRRFRNHRAQRFRQRPFNATRCEGGNHRRVARGL
jgi:hypothetical protein